MRRSLLQPVAVFVAAAAGLTACGQDKKPNPFDPVAECKPGTLQVKGLAGDRQLLMSSLRIAQYPEGFDLNGDGKVDNKLGPIGALANSAIDMQFLYTHDVIIPLELFGYSGSDSDCTKVAFYLGRINEDKDGDGKTTNWEAGRSDCDDSNPKVLPGMSEDLANRLDDDCDGYADNKTPGQPNTTDMMDLDGDGQSIAQGDCDDRMGVPVAAMRHKGAQDVCGNGIDEDCDGIADNDPSCDPFKDNKVPVHVTQLSFNGDKPAITFADGKVKGGVLTAGPDLFKLSVPFDKGVANLELAITGARLQLTLQDKPLGTYIPAQTSGQPPPGLLGGVLSANTLAQVKGINAGGVIKPDQSLLDAIFVGAAGGVLGLDSDKDGHYVPDIDVDGDGIEAFWQENKVNGQSAIVDTCRDGDGTIIKNNFDGQGTSCALAKDAKGNYRFVDGLSIALKFAAVPVKIADVVAK